MTEEKSLALASSLSISTDELMQLLDAMDAEVRNCAKAVEELDISEKDLRDYPLADVKRLGSDINGCIKAAEDARKEFKRRWQEPQKSIEAAFKAELEQAYALRDRYKGEQAKREANIRQERYDLLMQHYQQNATLLYNAGVPLEAFGIQRDKMSVAKGYSAVKEAQKLDEQLCKVLSEYGTLRDADLQFRDEVEGVFFQTLSLQQALEREAYRKAEHERLEQLHAELGEVEEPQEEPQPIAQPAEVPQRADSPATAQKLLRIDVTPKQWFGLMGYMKAAHIEYQVEG